MRESRVWDWFEKNSPQWLAIERIEVLYPPGLADCFWTDRRTGISGWLELKYCDPKDKEYRAGRIPKIRTEQPMFLSRQARNLVSAGILLRVGVKEAWHVWQAPGDKEWNTEVRSTKAISMANETWTGEIPSVSDIMDVLMVKL